MNTETEVKTAAPQTAPNPADKPLAQSKTPIQAGAQVQAIIPRDIDQVYRLASWIAQAGWAPKSYLLDPKNPSQGFAVTKISLGIMQGAEVGLSPIAALQSIAVINGMPSIYGDGAVALVQSSGLLEDWKETELKDSTSKVVGWKVEVKRRGQPTWRSAQFTMEDAKAAKLTEKVGPWKEYPIRQCLWRARAWAFRAGFADVLRGLHFAEEVIDITPTTTVTSAAEAPASTSAKSALDAFAGGEPPKENVVYENGNGRDTPPVQEPPAPAAPAAAAPGGGEVVDAEFVAGLDADATVPAMDGMAIAEWNAESKWGKAWKWLATTLPGLHPDVAQKVVTRHAKLIRAIISYNDKYAKQVNDLLATCKATLPNGE
ncbi:hypothetical protein UFOVP1040_46 [uncultured Caudovirales phage]|uniref:RecT family protein n=1 Tax=uncultured Caudovirales phage TaxID=2100421 RepID=A0A6J5QA03_9CAUD|nr:hypothetical protein UFOVP1040_46 [uncultured Caudovirales phage]